MALHKNFPKDKFAILEPEIRWFPVYTVFMKAMLKNHLLAMGICWNGIVKFYDK